MSRLLGLLENPQDSPSYGPELLYVHRRTRNVHNNDDNDDDDDDDDDNDDGLCLFC